MSGCQLTVDGYELQWGTNVLGHFIFTEILFPILKAAAATSPADTVRIVNTSSQSYLGAPPGGINLEDQTLGGKGGIAGYGQSKIGNIFLSSYWAEELKRDGIVTASVHPGAILTEGLRHFPRLVRWLIHYFLAYPTAKGAITQLYAGTSPEITLAKSGSFFVPWARIDETERKELHDEVIKEKVIELIKKQVAAVLD